MTSVTALPPPHPAGISRALIRELSRKDARVGIAKVAVFIAAVLALWSAYVLVEQPAVRVACVVLLGIFYAHGLELQHEALHGNLVESRLANRLIGFVVGAPMLVPFAHYRAYHLHHHRCVGTARDAELFDYTARSLANPVSLVVRAWNLIKIPAFLCTFLGILQGDYPAKVRAADRPGLVIECSLLAAMLAAAILLGGETALMLWLLPWLAVAEPVHFLVELPEHIGCDRRAPSILRNTRSYPANRVWAYLANYNNFHIEHHLYPTLPAHRLGRLHAQVAAAQGHCSAGYWQALGEVRQAVRDDRER